MVSISEWNELQRDASLFERDENNTSDGLKTRNPTSGTSLPRRFAQVSSAKSPYKKTVELVAYTNNAKRDREDVTLMIYRVHLSCPRGSRYKSVKLSFTFEMHGEHQDATPTEVLAWAPFNTQERFETGNANITSTTSIGGVMGAEALGKVEANVGRQWEKNFTQKLYGSAESDPDYHDKLGVMIGVQWYLNEAKLQEDGVLPDFHAAIAVKPPQDLHTQRALKFHCKVEVQAEAGFFQRAAAFFGGGREQNEPVIFDPALPPHFCGTGERVRAMLQPGSVATNNASGTRSGGLELDGCMEDVLLRIIGKINDNSVAG